MNQGDSIPAFVPPVIAPTMEHMELVNVFLVTGAPGAGHELLANECAKLSIPVATPADLIATNHAESGLSYALEHHSFTNFDFAMVGMLYTLLDDIQRVAQNQTRSVQKLNENRRKPNFVIILPSLVFLKRICPRTSAYLRQLLALPAVHLVSVEAEIQHLVSQNHLFGLGSGVFMPRRMIREQLVAFHHAVEDLEPIIIDTSDEKTPSQILAQILNDNYTKNK